MVLSKEACLIGTKHNQPTHCMHAILHSRNGTRMFTSLG